eukprot:CAMPEP_0194158536 /NCGR_PEP_ID=MMETSP0152-20130528/76533_1 /TAXON_ID=1049557 /ORGANISM="Thalassiothrix antarctica, Strain L6-D1" /LENGTH=264 /DNA_ID=CAMNT_0038867851 /DNA_START=14 /DNA_END=808 /DNA_ORIENTATION=-
MMDFKSVSFNIRYVSIMLLLIFVLSSSVDAGGAIVGCEKLRDKTPTIPDREYWTQLRNAYIEAISPKRSTINWTLTSSSSEDDDDFFTGLVAPCEIRISSETGRGIYATKLITKGSSIWVDRYHAIFEEEGTEAFEKFLSIVSWEQACDLLQWCYGHLDDDDDKKDGNNDEVDENNVRVACVLDEGTLFNHGQMGEANVGYLTEDSADMIALRDILEGEELTQDYDTFDEDLNWFEKLIDEAWSNASWEQEESSRKKEKMEDEF